MGKLLIFIILSWSTSWAKDCNPQEHLIDQKFFPYSFGKKVRTIDYQEFAEIAEYIKNFNNQKKYQLTKTEVVVCTSDYRLTPISVTHKNNHEHLDLAIQRASGLKKELNKNALTAQVSHKLCGPPFRDLDLNWRFLSKFHMKEKFEEAFKDIEKTEGLLEMYKNEALIKSFDEVKERYPEPFLAKYKPFNGYRLRLLGKENCSSDHHQIESSKEKGKGAQQE